MIEIDQQKLLDDGIKMVFFLGIYTPGLKIL